MKTRIEYLDGHRGAAILLVMGYHAFTRWPALTPYADAYEDFPIFKFGNLGVELFFLISGFVILMTLEKCSSAREFLYKRWLRLFPAMLVCSVLIYATAGVFFERPAGQPDPDSLLPGLTFIEPDWWAVVLGHPVRPLEGAFWSLFVEFKFYVFSALVFYVFGRKPLILGLALAFLTAVAAGFASDHTDHAAVRLLADTCDELSFEHFGWFASGAAFFIHSQDKSRAWFVVALSLALASACYVGGAYWQKSFVAVCVALFFAASVVVPLVQKLLQNRFLQFFGLISYPLYLIHENMMISLIVKAHRHLEFIPLPLLPLPAVAGLAGVAYLIVRQAEPRVRTLLSRLDGGWPSKRLGQEGR